MLQNVSLRSAENRSVAVKAGKEPSPYLEKRAKGGGGRRAEGDINSYGSSSSSIVQSATSIFRENEDDTAAADADEERARKTGAAAAPFLAPRDFFFEGRRWNGGGRDTFIFVSRPLLPPVLFFALTQGRAGKEKSVQGCCPVKPFLFLICVMLLHASRKEDDDKSAVKKSLLSRKLALPPPPPPSP